MSFIIRQSGKGRRTRRQPDDYHDERRGKPKQKPQKNLPPPEAREPFPRKVVIRNLPAQFTKEQFLQHVAPIPDYSYFAFHGPDLTLSNQARCRVYIRFKNEENVGIFKEKFDGYVFLDGRGHELRCMVELAPYQRTAIQNQEKNDPKCGQILMSEEYKRFLEDLEKKKDPVHTSSSAKVQASLAVIEAKAKELSTETVTPLMEFVRGQYEEREQQYPGRRPGKLGRFDAPPRKERPKEKGSKSVLSTQKGFRLSNEKPFVKNGPAIENTLQGNATAEVSGKKPVLLSRAREAPADGKIRELKNIPERSPSHISERPAEKSQTENRKSEVGNRSQGDTLSSLGEKRPHLRPPNALNQSSRKADELSSALTSEVDKNRENVRRADTTLKKMEPLFNPITGSKEFGRSDVSVVEVGPTAIRREAVVVGRSDQITREEVPDSGFDQDSSKATRVPNRARPSQQLYQPKARRRYQN